jgi:hypothetical protein
VLDTRSGSEYVRSYSLTVLAVEIVRLGIYDDTYHGYVFCIFTTGKKVAER